VNQSRVKSISSGKYPDRGEVELGPLSLYHPASSVGLAGCDGELYSPIAAMGNHGASVPALPMQTRLSVQPANR
jgi:hypothetical protein